MANIYAIYGLENTGPAGEYEATGEVHYYCTSTHATTHSIAEGFRSSANYSTIKKLSNPDDVLPGTVCEWCGVRLATGAAT